MLCRSLENMQEESAVMIEYIQAPTLDVTELIDVLVRPMLAQRRAALTCIPRVDSGRLPRDWNRSKIDELLYQR